MCWEKITYQYRFVLDLVFLGFKTNFSGAIMFQLFNIRSFSYFSGLECGFPGVPLNGSVSGSGMMYYPGETVTYNCQTGFVLFGPNTRNCTENGTWSLTVPECSKFLINFRHDLAFGSKTYEQKMKPLFHCGQNWGNAPSRIFKTDLVIETELLIWDWFQVYCRL